MRLLHATAEAVPFAKTGGLADVLGALPAAQAAAGHDVLVVHPWYAALRADPPPLWIGDVSVPFDGGSVSVGVGTRDVTDRAGDTRRFAFVGHEAFRRPALYGYPDDAWRFALFARAVPEVAARLGFAPDVVHVHDWHAALLPALLRHGDHVPSGSAGRPTVLTVHNAQYQGHADAADVVRWARLPGELAGPLALHGRGNLLHAGLVTADRVTTVSPGYARELGEGGVGYGLDATFAALGPRLSGILNGLDDVAFDPATDPALAHAFAADDLAGKRRCKEALEAELGLEAGRPLLGLVSRFADQKGIDLLIAAVPDLIDQGWNLAVLGAGDPGLEQAARSAFARHPGRVAGRVGYDDALARRIYAGADALALPSRFEPCGLAQLIAMRYATLPVARATGGLADTIDDDRTGFLFTDATPAALADALRRAREAYDDEARWAVRRSAAARERFGWDRAVAAYDALYGAARAERTRADGGRP
ncbi:MAG: glycogen/starch synthase [Trueperaceae bacterium]|nr:glycogen/starch synthase [Trueperaceae bacterium]